jgi:serine/threonine protein kinase
MMETIPSGTILHGRYRIERVLGSGGFGHVYLSVDLQTNQQFAVKEYLVSGASGQAQLQHEASVLSHLHHPNLPAFREAFNERGHYYVVLSYIEGSDLTDIIRIARQRNDAIPLLRIMTWVLSVCDAAMFLHNQQPPIIHRDIKPDNIRITPEGVAILVDLGNAKANADGARTLFFIRHQGTPGYAPQEQYPGGSGTTVRSDVYALGATLYFALTAHEPPSVSNRNQSLQQNIPDLPSLQDQLSNNPPEESLEANAQRQFRLGITKPSKPAPRHLRHLAQLGTLPFPLLNQLNSIIARAMAMQPRDRYHSVADFSNELRKVMSALQSLSSAQPPAPPRPLDPNSTQPDLPLLYEALEAAMSGQPAQSTVSSPPSPTSPPVTPASDPVKPAASPAQPYSCPRCKTQFAQKPAFCPNCGLSLSSAPKPNTPANTSQSPGNSGPSLQHKASTNFQSNNRREEKQQEHNPPRNANWAISQTPITSVSQPTARPVIAPISTLPPVPQTKPPTTQAQSSPTTEGSLQTSAQLAKPATPAQKPTAQQIRSARTPSISKTMLLIMITALILIVLIASLVFLIIKQTQAAQGSIQLTDILGSMVMLLYT